MRTRGINLVSLIIGSVIPRLALPVDSMCRRIIIEAFPPYGVVLKVVTYIGENGVTHSG